MSMSIKFCFSCQFHFSIFHSELSMLLRTVFVRSISNVCYSNSKVFFLLLNFVFLCKHWEIVFFTSKLTLNCGRKQKFRSFHSHSIARNVLCNLHPSISAFQLSSCSSNSAFPTTITNTLKKCKENVSKQKKNRFLDCMQCSMHERIFACNLLSA